MSGVEDSLAQVKAAIAGHGDRDGRAGTVGLLGRVCQTAMQTLAASGAGITVMAGDGVRGVSAASDPRSERLEELQFTLGEGPCIDAYASRRPVLVPDFETAMTRWPGYAPAVHHEGIRAVFAFPLQIGAARLGVLDIFRDRAVALTPDQLWRAVLLADAAVSVLLDQHEQADDGAQRADLDEAVENRAVLFQAQGMVMVQMGVSLGEAMARMRAYAYTQDRRLGEVARDIVARRLRFEPEHR
jgi:GAF domain/ANTAR domain